jgi:hypothetical protein
VRNAEFFDDCLACGCQMEMGPDHVERGGHIGVVEILHDDHAITRTAGILVDGIRLTCLGTIGIII